MKSLGFAVGKFVYKFVLSDWEMLCYVDDSRTSVIQILWDGIKFLYLAEFCVMFGR